MARTTELAAAFGKPGNDEPSGKYEQTWRKAYGNTTCRDFVRRMDDHERWVMAADMLFSAQRGDDPGAPLPPDRQVDTMEAAMREGCRGPGAELGIKVTEVAAALYVMADDLKP